MTARRPKQSRPKPEPEPEPEPEETTDAPAPLLSLDTLARERVHIDVDGEPYPIATSRDLSLRESAQVAQYAGWARGATSLGPNPPPEAELDDDHEFWSREQSEEEKRKEALSRRGLRMMVAIVLRHVPAAALARFTDSQRLQVMDAFIKASGGARLIPTQPASSTPERSPLASTDSTGEPPVPVETG